MTSDRPPVRPLYVYLQRPDNGEWVTVGRYLKTSESVGTFRYAPSYVEAGHPWDLDPVNLRRIPDVDFAATRYYGLHDVLRDACPDSWGRSLIAKTQGIASNAPDIEFLVRSGNADRWGSIAVGTSKSPSVTHLGSPRMDQLDALLRELLAIAHNQPTINPALRKKLLESSSAGGARPKFTVRDKNQYWLVKPPIASDVVDIARLEHATLQLGRRVGLNTCETQLHPGKDGRSAVLIKRFDRSGPQRDMCVSAASLLQVSYPPVTPNDAAGASYPRLAETLKVIGADESDRLELFDRMVFNAITGNDDDHARNHAVRYDVLQRKWRLTPAFDVVPNRHDTPTHLAMQVCAGTSQICRENMISDYLKFGFGSAPECGARLDHIARRITEEMPNIATILPTEMVEMMTRRVNMNRNDLSHVKPGARDL